MLNPISTYRIQVNHTFGFSAVEQIVNYLSRLGIVNLYLSPITEAQPGSLHGYDVINHNKINPELGGEAEFLKLSTALKLQHMGLLIDFVPNHMAATKYNLFWQDILNNGEQSSYAHFFDINWSLSKPGKIVYRRFFDVNELICLHMEDDHVFKLTHKLILDLIKNQHITGLRIDHIDGLMKPYPYLQQLRQKVGAKFYLIVEKILAYDETLAQNWPVAGTTGYEFINHMNLIFVSKNGFQQLQKIYSKLTNNKDTVDIVRYKSNKFVIRSLFINELNFLSDSLWQLSQICGEDYKRIDLRNAIISLSAAMPIYRTYFSSVKDHLIDSNTVRAIIQKAQLIETTLNSAIWQFVNRIFEFKFPAHFTALTKQKWLAWILRWQLFTGPMIAKGYEDTTCYRYNPLISINEVGSDPGFFQHLGDVSKFHAYNQYKQLNYPMSLNATSTHDTKRSEDVRARINVLSELSQEWIKLVRKWCINNSSKKDKVAGHYAPSINEEFLIYQTLIGAWPLDDTIQAFKQRFKTYIYKMLKEAKINSSWRKPNAHYEFAVENFCDQLITEHPDNYFLPEFIQFQQKVAFYGMLNSLSQVAIKITAPGIPDFYQGNEMWQFDLVDPDNRHPVNFKLSEHILTTLLDQKTYTNDFYAQLLTNWSNGQIKLYITYKLLNFRNKNLDLFLQGTYTPLATRGIFAENIFAFTRQYKQQWLLVIIPRLTSEVVEMNSFPLGKTVWQDTSLLVTEDFPTHWRDVITGSAITTTTTNSQVGNFLVHLPIGVYTQSV